MLDVSLDTNNNLHVRTTSTLVRLQPAPGSFNSTSQVYEPGFSSFDPAQKWSVLNGTAFSRVLGWYDEGTTGANGDNFYETYSRQLTGNYVWIEKIGGSQELKTYQVSEAGDPFGPYTPIFGTAGSSTLWRWDGFMDHNVYAVALTDLTNSNQKYTATYHLYVGDSNANPVPGFGATETTWTWQGPSVAFRPSLSIQKQTVIEWSAGLAQYALEVAESSDSPNWIEVTNSTAFLNGKNIVVLDSVYSSQIFRLRLIP